MLVSKLRSIVRREMLTKNILHGPRIRLTAIAKADLATISIWYEDAAYSRMFDATPAVPKSQVQLEQWLEGVYKAKDSFLFAVRPLNEELLLGYVELDTILWAHQNCWVGIGLGNREHWGQGYGRESMELALNFAFHELNLYRVQLTVFSYNERAINLYDKLGFKREGVFRDFIQRDGRRHDMILFGLLRQEWAERRSNLEINPS
jgi:RimJ/RimL family protein N-acetyltransferase